MMSEQLKQIIMRSMVAFIFLAIIAVISIGIAQHSGANIIPTYAPAHELAPSVTPQACPLNSTNCGGQSPSQDQPLYPGTNCCCKPGYEPHPDGSKYKCRPIRCGTRKTVCYGQSPDHSQPVVPGTNCCCKPGFVPGIFGVCRRWGCHKTTFYCGGQSPGEEFPTVPGTSCCCLGGLKPGNDGKCYVPPDCPTGSPSTCPTNAPIDCS